MDMVCLVVFSVDVFSFFFFFSSRRRHTRSLRDWSSDVCSSDLACRQASEWLREQRLPIQVAVNLSSQQFNNYDLVDCVRRALRAAQLEPGYLKLEITEGALIQDPKQIGRASCRERGEKQEGVVA